jgi:hypothetical protein
MGFGARASFCRVIHWAAFGLYANFIRKTHFPKSTRHEVGGTRQDRSPAQIAKNSFGGKGAEGVQDASSLHEL